MTSWRGKNMCSNSFMLKTGTKSNSFKWSDSSLNVDCKSFCSIGRRPSVTVSLIVILCTIEIRKKLTVGSLYSSILLASVILSGNWKNSVSTDFSKFRERYQYLKHEEVQKWIWKWYDLLAESGFGMTRSAEYAAWKIPCWFTRRIISFMSTESTSSDLQMFLLHYKQAAMFHRIVLCTRRKFISTIFTTLSYTRKVWGIAPMNAKSLPPSLALTPQCHCCRCPGTRRALP